MARESSQAALEPEGCLARMSRWATAFLVIPMLTGLSFAASTIFFYLTCFPPGFSHDPEALPIPIVCFVLGVGLGFLLRRVMIRVRDAGRPRTGIWVVVGWGLAWIAAYYLQYLLLYYGPHYLGFP